MALSLSIGTSQLSQSVSGNYTTLRVNVNISWTFGSWDHYGSTKYVTINGSTYYFSSAKINPNRTNSGSQTLYSVDVNIPHNSDGTKTVSIYAYVVTSTGSGTVTASASPTLSRIPRTSPATLSASSVTTGGSFTVYTNRYSSSFTHTIKITLGSKSITKTGIGTSVTITIPRDWAEALPNAASGTATVVCTTDGIGSVSKNITVNVNSNDIPTLTEVTVAPYSANTVVSGWNIYLQGYSAVQVTFNTAAGVYGSSIAGYKVVYGSSEVTKSPYRTPVINNSGAQKVYCYAKDSRGRWSKAKEVSVEFLSYAKPSLSNAQAYRSKDTGVKDEKNGTSLSAIATAVFSSCGGKNSATLKCRRRRRDGDWMSYVSMQSGKLTTFAQGAVSVTYSYEVEIKITDALGETNEVIIEIPTKAAALSFLPEGKGAAVGKVAEKEGVLEVAFDIETEGSVTTGDILINDPDLEELWESVFGGGVIPKLIDYIYPLGSVIASVNSAFDPNEAYKSQTWVRFAEGRTLVGVDTSDTDFKTVEKTGGEKTHKLTLYEIPSHEGHLYSNYDMNSIGNCNRYLAESTLGQYGSAGRGWNSVNGGEIQPAGMSRGGGAAHNNMQPYISVYYWKRTK